MSIASDPMPTATTTLRTVSANGVPVKADPPLESGDRMSVEEFDRRYAAAEGVRAEYLFGVVYVASPVRSSHGRPHFRLIHLAGVYQEATPHTFGDVDSTVYLTDDLRVQPDIALTIAPEKGGLSTCSKDGYLVGPVELAIEVAMSSVSYDLHAKKEAYRLCGVPEYIVWRVYDGLFDWFVLRDGEYEPLGPHEGLLKSKVFPGFWVDPAALLKNDVRRLKAALARGLASPEHAAFVAKLATEGGSS